MSYLNERREELDSDCVFSTGSLLRYSSSNNGPSPSPPSSNIHGRLGAAFRPRSSTDSIPFVDADISSSPGQTRESGSRQRPQRLRAASSSEDDATFVQRRSPPVKPSPLRYLNKRHSTGSQVSKLHSSYGDIDDTTSLNNLLDALDDLEDDFRCVSEDSVDCCDFVDVMSMPRGQLWTQSTGRLTGNNNNNAPHVRYNDIHSNSLQRPSPSIQNPPCLVKPAVHSGVKIAEKSSIIVSNHASCVSSPEALQSSSGHVGSCPQPLVQARSASSGYVQQRQTGSGQWNGKPRAGSKMPCVVSGDSVHSHLSCGSNRVQQIAGDRARIASLRPSNSVNSHVSFHLPSPTQRNKDSDWNHCPALTPPSSPLDLSPPGPALASAHYISSLRASSRRGGGASPDKERDPLARLLRFLRAFYRELAGRDPANPPPWAPPLPSGTLCPAHFQPALQLAPLGGRSDNEPRDSIRLDQILSAVRTSEGVVHEAPRRVVVEGAPGSGKTTLALRLLYSWATQDEWLGPSIQLALFIPLRELRGNTLAHYLSKELLPKSALGTTYSNNGFAHVWKCLGLLEDRLLFVLDGYDEALSGQDKGGQDKGGREALGDAIELLEGRLFPECRILVTCCPGWSSELIPLVQRRVVLHGLDWPHVERLAMAYFDGNKQPECANRFLEVVGASTQVLRPLACWPLGWLLLCVLYEETGGHIPSDTLDVHQALFKCLIRRSLSNKGDILMSSSSTQDLPGHCKKLLAEFGKLALSCIKEDRFLYTDSEIRLHCRGGGLEVTELGFLTRGLNFGRSHGQKKRAEYYTPLLRTFAEFLAAYYISSVVHYANILKRELEDLPGLSNCGGAPPDHGTVLILRFLMGLLARKGHLVFNQLCPLDFPTRTLFMLLQAAGPGEANVAAVCRLLGASSGGFFGIGITGSVSKIPVPLVHTAPLELEGWAHVLRSETCSLEALELVYQFDKGADCEELLDVFFAALAANDSVRLVRISSLLGHEFTAAEVARLAAYVKTTLPKSRLHTFELVITCLEDSAHDRFQSLVTALCDGLTDGASPSLNKLVLDLNLGTSQVVQLCAALELATQVSVLHLPHLGCGRDGLRAIARLIRARPLVALNLAGSWGMRRDDPPSSSGVSVGSGSGSSGVNTLQHGGKQASTTSSISPKTSTSSYYFSSLPRGVMGAYNSLSRPATLPRQPLQQILDGYGNGGDSKRNSDSVLFQRLFHPLPACDPAAHSGSGFHDVFEAAREPNCKLRSLNVSKCILEAEDALCLGETVRRSLCLDALRLEGGTRLGEVLPVLLGLADNTSLQLLDLGSQRLILEDGPTQLVCQSLAKNSSLRLLSLDGWTFRIEEEGSLAVFLVFLQTTSVRDLVLANCRLHLAIHDGRLSRLGRHDDSVAELLTFLPDFQCPSVVFLRLGGFQVTVNDRMALRGPHLLPFLKGFSHLSDLDLSLDKNTSGSANSNPLLIDDKVLISFFQTLSTSFRTLQSLKMSHWKICLDDSERTLRTMGRALKTCSLSYLKVNGLGVTDGSHKGALEHLFLQTVVANLSYLSWLSMVGVALTTGQAASLAKCIRDRFPGTVLELTAKDVGSDAVKTLVAVAEEGNKVEVIYMGGPSCNLRIHRLMKNHKLRGKFRRFTSLKE